MYLYVYDLIFVHVVGSSISIEFIKVDIGEYIGCYQGHTLQYSKGVGISLHKIKGMTGAWKRCLRRLEIQWIAFSKMFFLVLQYS